MAIVIGLTGPAASGKGTAAEYLKSRYGFEVFSFSDIIKEEARRRGFLKGKSMEEIKYELSKFGELWRKETKRADIAAQKIIERIFTAKVEKAVVDGFRAVEEVELFRKSFQKFILVLINASKEVRWKRRLKQDPNAKREEFERRDQIDIERKGLGKVMQMVDIVIDNNGTIEQLYTQLDKLISDLGKT